MTRVRLECSKADAEWLATAVTVLRRILEGVRDTSDGPSPDYCCDGLLALHRLAEQLPAGIYPDDDVGVLRILRV
jgi:hypothetical protein